MPTPTTHAHRRSSTLDCAGAPSTQRCPCFSTHPATPFTCREPPAEFEAVNAYFSGQVHAFFDALHALEDMSAQKSPGELDLIRQDDGLWPTIRLVNQSFDIHPDCLHRIFHTRRLTVQNPDSLPLLYRVTQLARLPRSRLRLRTGHGCGQPAARLPARAPRPRRRWPLSLKAWTLCLLDCAAWGVAWRNSTSARSSPRISSYLAVGTVQQVTPHHGHTCATSK